jgi:hypothetical protein
VIAFQSNATNLVPGDYNNASDVLAFAYPSVTITTPALPGGTVGVPYHATISGSGGGGALTFTVGPGLPPGLALSSGGILAGTPTSAGSYTFTVTATDAVCNMTTQSYTVVISPMPLYVDPTFTGPAGSDPASDPGLGLQIGVNAFSTIAAALAAAQTGTMLTIFGGTYNEPAVNFNVALAGVNLATNPSDSPVSPTVTISNAVLISVPEIFSLQGVTTGVVGSMTANLIFGATVDGTGALTIQGNAGLTFAGPVSAAVLLLGGQLNPTASLTLAGSGSLTVGAGLSETIGSLVSTSPSTSVQLVAGSSLSTNGTTSSMFTGSITGSGALNKLGATTTLTLSGTNSYTGSTRVIGTLTVNGSLGATTGPVSLTDPSSILNGTGSILRPVIVTSTASGASISGVTITAVGGIGIDVQAGADNVLITGVTATGSAVGMRIEPGDGNMTTISTCAFLSNMEGLEVLSGCITANNNVLGGAAGQGNNVGVYVPAVNPTNSSLPVDPLLTLERNVIDWNATGLENASTMGLTAILNWWGSSAGPGLVDMLGRNPVAGVNVADYTPYALDSTSAGFAPTTFDFFNGTGTDGNVYVTGTPSADSIRAAVDSANANLIHVTGPVSGDYTRGDGSKRLIIYGFGSNAKAARDTISVSGSWDAEIHSGPGTNSITTSGSGSDVIFGGGNDSISVNTTGNNVLVAGLSTGPTWGANGPRLTAGSGDNLFIAGSLDCTLAPLAPSGRFDYATLRSLDDLWAAGSGGMADAMNAAALFSVASTPGEIMTGSARALILAGSGQNWFVVKGDHNPVNTPGGMDTDYVGASTASPSYRQAIQ